MNRKQIKLINDFEDRYDVEVPLHQMDDLFEGATEEETETLLIELYNRNIIN